MAVRAAAVQLTTTLDKAANRAAVTAAVERAVLGRAELVVFPEATMCSFGGQSEPLRPYAESLDGPFVRCLTELARDHRLTLVAGMFEPADGDRVFNTIVAVGPEGLIGHYRKVHLYDAFGWRESERIAAGPADPEALLVFRLGEFTCGVMNCYDLRFPEMARLLVDRGADVLLEPANWINGPGKRDVWQTLLRARAIESTAYVVAAAKPEPECAGASVLIDPGGEILAALGPQESAVIEADLSLERVREVRQVVPVLENRRFRVVPAGPVPRDG